MTCSVIKSISLAPTIASFIITFCTKPIDKHRTFCFARWCTFCRIQKTTGMNFRSFTVFLNCNKSPICKVKRNFLILMLKKIICLIGPVLEYQIAYLPRKIHVSQSSFSSAVVVTSNSAIHIGSPMWWKLAAFAFGCSFITSSTHSSRFRTSDIFILENLWPLPLPGLNSQSILFAEDNRWKQWTLEGSNST